MSEPEAGGGGSARTAIVTGANHGIGAATAIALARAGCSVLCTFLRVADPVDPGIPPEYRANRAAGCDAVRAVVDASSTLVHVASPAQVAAVIAYLASDAARLITGNVITLR